MHLHVDDDEEERSKSSIPRRRKTFLGGLFRRSNSDEKDRKEAQGEAEDETTFEDTSLVSPTSRDDAVEQIQTEKPGQMIVGVPRLDLPLGVRNEAPYTQRGQMDETQGDEHRRQHRTQDHGSVSGETLVDPRSQFREESWSPPPPLPPPPEPISQQEYLNTPQTQSADGTRPSLADYTRKISSMYFATANEADQIDGFESVEEGINSSDDEYAVDDHVGPNHGTRRVDVKPNTPQIPGVDVDVLRDLVREELRKIVVDGPVISDVNSNEHETKKQPMGDVFQELDATFESDYVDDEILSALEGLSENYDDGYIGNEYEALVQQHNDNDFISEARESGIESHQQPSSTLDEGDIFNNEHEDENEEESIYEYEYEYEYETYDDANYSESNPQNVCSMDRMEVEIEERVRLEVAEKEAELKARCFAEKEKEIERVRAEEAEKMAKKIEAERAEAEQIAREKTIKAERIKQKRIMAKRLKKERVKFEQALANKDKEMERQRSHVVYAGRKAKGTFLSKYSPEQITEMSEEELDRIIGQKNEE